MKLIPIIFLLSCFNLLGAGAGFLFTADGTSATPPRADVLTQTNLFSEFTVLPDSTGTNYVIPATNGVALFINATNNIYLVHTTNLSAGWRAVLRINQDSTGNRTITWLGNTNQFWSEYGGRVPLTTNGLAVDVFDLFYLSSTNVGYSRGNYLRP